MIVTSYIPLNDLNALTMLNHTTLAQLRALKLQGFADVL